MKPTQDDIKPKEMNCKKCGSLNTVLVEYAYYSPQHWDGWSEKRCGSCGAREGRWSGKFLGEKEEEDKKLRFEEAVTK
jgi:hypothetical protein